MDHYSFCHTGPLDCQSVLALYYFFLFFEMITIRTDRTGDGKEKDEEKRSWEDAQQKEMESKKIGEERHRERRH